MQNFITKKEKMSRYTVPVRLIVPHIRVGPSDDELNDPDAFLDWINYCFRQSEVVYTDKSDFINGVDLQFFLRDGHHKRVELQDPVLLNVHLSYMLSPENIFMEPLACIDFRDDIDKVKFLSTAGFIDPRINMVFRSQNVQLLLVPAKMKLLTMDYLESNLLYFLSIVDRQNRTIKTGNETIFVDSYLNCNDKKHDGTDYDYGEIVDLSNHTTCYFIQVIRPFRQYFLDLVNFIKGRERMRSLFDFSKNVLIASLESSESRTSDELCDRGILFNRKLAMIDKNKKLGLPTSITNKITQEIKNNEDYLLNIARKKIQQQQQE